MATLCPNCSRPARKGAQYCGFCGTNLKSPVRLESAVGSAQQVKTASNRKSKGGKQINGKRRDPGRTAAVIAIILLILIISTALVGQYWAQILTYIITTLSAAPAG